MKALVPLIALLLASGCSATAAEPPVDLDSYCPRRAERICRDLGCGGDSCLAEQGDACAREVADEQLEGRAFDPEAARTCIDSLDQASCARVWRGQVALGGACLGPSDCAANEGREVDCAITEEEAMGACVLATAALDAAPGTAGSAANGDACEDDGACASILCFRGTCADRSVAEAIVCVAP